MTLHQPPGGQPLRSIDALVDAGLVSPARGEALQKLAERYAVSVTPAVADLIDAADPADPIARQFIPDAAELTTLPQELADPIGDEAHSPVEGVVHRYPDRALLKLVHACPVYCRFCFRREMVGPGGDALTGQKLDAALAYLASRPQIWEVIMTGGDPFILSARRIRDVAKRLAAIPHIKVTRWHTRVPVVDPGRITPDYAKALRIPGKASYIAIHANHPREFTDAACAAIATLADAGHVLLSQSVLLKGVNADVETLGALMRSFVENRIKPYYLHHPDLAPGTSHFRLTLEEGQTLVKSLRGNLSGLCQPTYILDIPGGAGKIPVGPSFLSGCETPGAEAIAEDRQGGRHRYPPT
ncbi:MAG: lysine-2,3-aminomutase-like protein [Bosea sp.]|uniref:lysine-2,3-aminomutase-like protein n=1 Tax=unclassified Bosea (in: a-proteobacteria) TaxID=2653178 RepID=UPI0009667FF0|nr:MULTISPECIES: lysine-2,3-aminomutase-like protein [unclassified Bosea (in: a-proteobacteria)]MBN9459181.1 lysine-2,3-aminomutase-like protein [Bosea sp. (in: a-proteobacteria)]OJV06473.1 MAG: lysine 2,3-aminomutase [Bosea sp. 67-29]